MCMCVHVCLQGIVHRDIKSENVFRTASGAWKLGDFGSSLRIGDERLLNKQVCWQIHQTKLLPVLDPNMLLATQGLHDMPCTTSAAGACPTLPRISQLLSTPEQLCLLLSTNITTAPVPDTHTPPFWRPPSPPPLPPAAHPQVIKLEGTYSFAAPEYIQIWDSFTRQELLSATTFKVGL
jgi:serine/threonine protein kinase